MSLAALTLHHVWTGLRTLLVFTLLLGVIYPLALVVAGLPLPQAQGSPVHDRHGKAVGSALIGQDFSRDRALFQSRPSAAGDTGYDGLASGASNLAPTSRKLAERIVSTRAKIAAREGVDPSRVPADAVTASGSGLDPHISPAYAQIQVARVAKQNHLSETTVKKLVAQHTEHPLLGFIGADRVNVLRLNLAVRETSERHAAH